MNSQPGAPSNFFNAGSSSSVPDRSPEDWILESSRLDIRIIPAANFPSPPPPTQSNPSTFYIVVGKYIIILAEKIAAFDMETKTFTNIIWDPTEILLKHSYSYYGCVYKKERIILFENRARSDAESRVEKIYDITLSEVERGVRITHRLYDESSTPNFPFRIDRIFTQESDLYMLGDSPNKESQLRLWKAFISDNLKLTWKEQPIVKDQNYICHLNTFMDGYLIIKLEFISLDPKFTYPSDRDGFYKIDLKTPPTNGLLKMQKISLENLENIKDMLCRNNKLYLTTDNRHPHPLSMDCYDLTNISSRTTIISQKLNSNIHNIETDVYVNYFTKLLLLRFNQNTSKLQIHSLELGEDVDYRNSGEIVTQETVKKDKEELLRLKSENQKQLGHIINLERFGNESIQKHRDYEKIIADQKAELEKLIGEERVLKNAKGSLEATLAGLNAENIQLKNNEVSHRANLLGLHQLNEDLNMKITDLKSRVAQLEEEQRFSGTQDLIVTLEENTRLKFKLESMTRRVEVVNGRGASNQNRILENQIQEARFVIAFNQTEIQELKQKHANELRNYHYKNLELEARISVGLQASRNQTSSSNASTNSSIISTKVSPAIICSLIVLFIALVTRMW